MGHSTRSHSFIVKDFRETDPRSGRSYRLDKGGKEARSWTKSRRKCAWLVTTSIGVRNQAQYLVMQRETEVPKDARLWLSRPRSTECPLSDSPTPWCAAATLIWSIKSVVMTRNLARNADNLRWRSSSERRASFRVPGVPGIDSWAVRASIETSQWSKYCIAFSLVGIGLCRIISSVLCPRETASISELNLKPTNVSQRFYAD